MTNLQSRYNHALRITEDPDAAGDLILSGAELPEHDHSPLVLYVITLVAVAILVTLAFAAGAKYGYGLCQFDESVGVEVNQ